MTLTVKHRKPVEPANRRVSDEWGQGHYGAPRGTRTHNGIDFLMPADSDVLSTVTGTVTKVGFAYAGESYRYVEVSALDGFKVRHFYVQPGVAIGQSVVRGDTIGYCQDLAKKFPGDENRRAMPNHVHIEVFKIVDGDRQYTDPDQYDFA